MERTPEQVALHRRIMDETIARKGVKLKPIEISKLEQACWKAIDENEALSLNEYLIATSIYLNFILQYPDLSL